MKTRAYTCLWLTALVSVVFLNPVLAQESKTAPDFELLDQNGKLVKLSDLLGKVVVLEWTNPECPFVKRHYSPETMTMVKLAKSYKDQPVVWLAINSTNFHDQAYNKEWHDKLELPYPVLDDHTGKVGRLYGATNTPHLYVVDTEGKLAYQGAIDDKPRGGDASVNYVKQAIDALLAGQAPSPNQTKPYGCTVKYAR